MKCGKEEKYEKTKEMKIIFWELGAFHKKRFNWSSGPLASWPKIKEKEMVRECCGMRLSYLK